MVNRGFKQEGRRRGMRMVTVMGAKGGLLKKANLVSFDFSIFKRVAEVNYN